MNTAAVDSLLHWLLRTSIEASILILAVLGLRLMLGTRLSPAWRIGLWMLVGAKLMLPAFIPAGFGLGAWMKIDDTATRSASMVSAYSPASLNAPQVITATTSPIAPNEMTSDLPTDSRSNALSSPAISHSTFRTPHFLLALWLLGSIAVLLIAVIQQTRFNALLRRRPRGNEPLLRALVASLAQKVGLKQPVSIVLMPAGTTPAMVGISQPKLLLPVDWSTRFDENSLKHVVLHELVHVKQRDLIWNWAATAVQALHWFNPLVWFVVSRFQADRELRCDAAALEILAPSERLDYGHTLLRIQETFFAPPAIAGLAPCVRNHPTLRQRILMIATPTTRQPMIHALLVLTLSVLASYSFTTARAAEKEVPPKVREGETIKKTGGEEGASVRKGDGEREGGEKKPAMRDGEGEGARKPGARDGEGGAKKPGTRDGEGARKPGARDGEGGAKKPGPRDGEEGARKPGARDGEGGAKKPGARDGEGGAKTGARDGEGSAKVRKGEGDSASGKSSEVITMHVSASGDTVLINGEKQPVAGLRSHLREFLPEHPGAKVLVSGDPDTPLKSLHQILDAVRDNGNKNVSIKAE
ncbi:MAG: biopolymer transporter ExbD [Verrucomicrobiaceae bacterium]|nr:biopolymer transporter ExbD [Verrucomicrobiaceae bacterium]